MNRIVNILMTAFALVLLAACAAPQQRNESDVATGRWGSVPAGVINTQPWTHYKLPGKTPSQFEYALEDGRDAIAAKAQSSASMLRQMVRLDPKDFGNLRFSWKLPDLIQYADMSLREFDDSPVRVVLAFEGDRAKFSAKNAMLSELAHVLTGEPLPYATLMYVWCNECEPHKVILNPHTDRIRKLPLETGTNKLNQWIAYDRAVRTDFVNAFGEEPGLLSSISIMTDTDNTKSVARAFYGPVQLLPKAP
jgi:Protein of unknown function (DUF3047)